MFKLFRNMNIALFDWYIVIGFMSLTIMIGVIVSKNLQRVLISFFFSRNMPWWLSGISMKLTFSTDTPNLVTEIVRIMEFLEIGCGGFF